MEVDTLLERSRYFSKTRRYRQLEYMLSRLSYKELIATPELGRDLAVCYLFLHRTEAGLILTASLLEGLRGCGNKVIIGQILILRGGFLCRDGRIVEAESAYLEAVDSSGWLESTPIVAEAHNGLGIISSMKGNWAAGISIMQRALVIYQRLGDRRGVASLFHNIAVSFRYLEMCKEAELYFKRAYRYYFSEGTEEEKVMVEAERSLALLGIGDVALAEAMARRAYKRCNAIAGEELLGDCLRVLGTILAKSNDSKEAYTYLGAALANAEKYEKQFLKAEINEEFALLGAAEGNSVTAKTHYDRAKLLYRELEATGHCERLERRYSSHLALVTEP